MREILEDIVTIRVAAGIIYDMEAVYVEHHYPVGVIEQLSGFVCLLTDYHELVAVCNLCDFVYISKTLDEEVFLMFLSYINDSTAEERESVLCTLNRLVAVGIPAVDAVSGAHTHISTADFGRVLGAQSAVELNAVVRMNE